MTTPGTASAGRRSLVVVLVAAALLLVGGVAGVAVWLARSSDGDGAERADAVSDLGEQSGLAGASGDPAAPDVVPPGGGDPPDAADPTATPGAGDASPSGPYVRYTNPRFGFSCEVPSVFVPGDEPANGDGQGFSSTDGASTVICAGANNVAGETAEAAHAETIARLEAGGAEITYEPLNGDVSTISGYTADGDVFYVRTVWGVGSSNTLSWVYPPAELEPLRGAVEHSEDTFAPGRVEQSH